MKFKKQSIEVYLKPSYDLVYLKTIGVLDYINFQKNQR